MSQFEKNRKQAFARQLQEIMKNRKTPNGKKLTQQALAKAVCVQRETVSRWVRGISCPLDDELVMSKLCNFLSVPPTYFTKNNYSDGWTMIDEKTHNDLNDNCSKVAEKIGLKSCFVAFLKENPELADHIIRSSWIDGIMQSLSPEVPEITEHLFQFVSSTGVKIYPPDDVLYMIRVVQRDTEEFVRFLLSKYTRIYDDYHASVREILRKSKTKESALVEERGSLIEIENESGMSYPKPPIVVFSDILRGREDLSVDENHILDLYRTINNEGKNAVYSVLMQERKKHPSKKTKAIREAVRKAIAEKKPVPPTSEIYPEE